MKTLIERANDKGWTINTGTLQAQGFFNAYRNNAKTDDDVTLWCPSAKEAAKEALKMDKETRVKVNKKKWTVFDPRDKYYISAYCLRSCSWSGDRDKAFQFETKADARDALFIHGFAPVRYVITAHEVKA